LAIIENKAFPVGFTMVSTERVELFQWFRDHHDQVQIEATAFFQKTSLKDEARRFYQS
jgi:hypothetical protein